MTLTSAASRSDVVSSPSCDASRMIARATDSPPSPSRCCAARAHASNRRSRVTGSMRSLRFRISPHTCLASSGSSIRRSQSTSPKLRVRAAVRATLDFLTLALRSPPRAAAFADVPDAHSDAEAVCSSSTSKAVITSMNVGRLLTSVDSSPSFARAASGCVSLARWKYRCFTSRSEEPPGNPSTSYDASTDKADGL
eukprot:scaffold19909_cov130-Isochrysis_galbana.AAC.2